LLLDAQAASVVRHTVPQLVVRPAVLHAKPAKLHAAAQPQPPAAMKAGPSQNSA